MTSTSDSFTSRPCLVLENLLAGWAHPVTPPVSLTLHSGEVLGLAGPNGTGKSTLLAAILGKATRFSGSLYIAPNSQISFQPQQACPVQGIPLSGQELLAISGASPIGLPDWLTPHLHQRLDKLSGGQRQYLALWAILNRPADLILLDEPSNHLDQAGTKHLALAIRQRARIGCGILIISHEPDLLNACCDRILTLADPC